MIRFEDIADKLARNYPKVDLSVLEKAYVFSAREHANQFRKSGEPYLAHPLEVANILVEMGLDVVAVTVGLLHDVVEDTLTDLDTIRRLFGDTVATVVDGVTKISQIPFTSVEHKQAENFRKLLLAMSNDVRVILVKLADRLHNMRTLQHLRPEQQQRIARETMDIYVPIANRLGMGKIKGELEDLAFYYLEPEQYQQVISLVGKRRAVGEKLLQEVETRIRQTLDAHQITAQFQTRIKRVYSIAAKMKRQKITFDEVYDFLALRVITDTMPNCYQILGLVHNTWKMVPGRFKDFISMPRQNGYQSVHTTVMCEAGIPVEIQIRTHEMHRLAEEGIAAHWRYKESGSVGGDVDQRFTWLRRLLEWQKEVDDPHEFLSNLKIDLYPEEVYAFTPQGHVITLPKGSTPIDFAYEIHTELGHRCQQARVNSRLVPLKYQLKHGDVVEIMTAKDRHPTRDWLACVKTARARNKIRQWLRKHESQEAQEIGRKILEKEGIRRKLSLKAIQGHSELTRAMQEMGVGKFEDLLAEIGFGRISPHGFLECLERNESGEAREGSGESMLTNIVHRMLRKGSGTIFVNGMDDILVNRARCCNPIPGEDIVGYISRGRGIIIHAAGCHNLQTMALPLEKKVDVSWGKPNKDEMYTITLLVYTEDRKGMIADISGKLAKNKVNIREFKARSDESRTGVFQISMDVEDLTHLEKIVKILKSVPNVNEVRRTEKNRHETGSSGVRSGRKSQA